MDTQAKQNQQQPADQPQQVPVQPQPNQPVNPISGPHKEVAPLSGRTSEYVTPTESKPELAKEVVEAGVEHTPDQERPNLPTSVIQAGVTHAKEHTVHPVEPQGSVQLPTMSQQQAILLKKKAPVKNAARWLAEYVLRQFDKIAYQKLPTK